MHLHVVILFPCLSTKKSPFLGDRPVVEGAIDSFETSSLCLRHHKSADEDGEEGREAEEVVDCVGRTGEEDGCRESDDPICELDEQVSLYTYRGRGIVF